MADRLQGEEDQPRRGGPVPEVLFFFHVAASKEHGDIGTTDEEQEGRGCWGRAFEEQRCGGDEGGQERDNGDEDAQFEAVQIVVAGGTAHNLLGTLGELCERRQRCIR